MRKFFERVKTQGEAPQIASFSNLVTFYSLLFFLLTIPFILIVGLVWITGVVGFSPYIIAGVALLGVFFCWRLYRKWQKIKARMAAQGSEFRDFMAAAARSGKDIEVNLLNGLVTFRYQGRQLPLQQLPSPVLALAPPEEMVIDTVEAVRVEETLSNPDRLRRELEEFSRLRDAGVISPEEFEAIKNRLVARFVNPEGDAAAAALASK